jgi:STE24 endopeptidase
MRDPRQWLGCLLLVFLPFLPAAAQEEPDDEGETGGLSFDADARGDAKVMLWLRWVDDPRAALERVRKVLPCSLEEPEDDDPDYLLSYGHCPGLFRRDGSLLRGRLDLGPVVRAAGLKESFYFYGSIDLPATAFHSCGGWERNPDSATGTGCMALLGRGGLGGAATDVAYGFRASDLAWRFGLIGALVLAPIPLLLRRRRRVLAAEGEARLSAWFDYWRAYRGIHLGGWLLWIAGVYALRLDDWAALVAPGTFTHQLLLLVLILAPPALVFLAGQELSQPVLVHVRELARTSGEARREALSYLLLSMVPLSFTLVGVGAMSEDVTAGSLWLLAGFVMVLVGRWVYARVLRIFPHALTPGDLRERIYGIARQAGVRLQEVYILPAAQRRMANAFATSGNHVLLTDYLVAHLSRRELEAVVAHEMGHLRRRHTLVIPVVLLAIYFGWLYASHLLGDAVATVDPLPLLLLSGLLPLRLLLRRFERSADAQAVNLTKDPEALISALGKLARLSLLPLRWTWWGDTTSTHPSMIRRGEALARRFGLPRERMERLLRGDDALGGPDEAGYELPAATLSEDRVFTTRVKTRAGLVTLWCMILACVLSGVLPSWAIHLAGLWFGHAWGVYALALVCGFLAVELLVNFLALRGLGDLSRGLKERLEREGLSVADGVFVGFAPDDSPRLYEGQGVWDVGFLVPGRDGFAFLGDQARFHLRREQVTAVRLGPGTPGWWRIGSVFVDWRSDEGWTRTFHLRGRGRTLLEVRRNTKALAEQLASWLRSPEGGDLPELPPPPVVDAGGLHPREALRLRSVFVVCYLIFVLCAVSSLALQDFQGLLTASMVGIAIYLAHVAPYWWPTSTTRSARRNHSSKRGSS